MLDQLRPGNVVVMTKYDRLSRSLQDLLTLVEQVRARGAGFLFTDPRHIRLKSRLMGHRIASEMQGMGILKQVVEQSIEGILTEPRFYAMIRKRREYHRYMKDLLVQLQEKKRYYLVAPLCAHYLSTRGGPKFRRTLKEAVNALEAEGRPAPPSGIPGVQFGSHEVRAATATPKIVQRRRIGSPTPRRQAQ